MICFVATGVELNVAAKDDILTNYTCFLVAATESSQGTLQRHGIKWFGILLLQVTEVNKRWQKHHSEREVYLQKLQTTIEELQRHNVAKETTSKVRNISLCVGQNQRNDSQRTMQSLKLFTVAIAYPG